MWWKKEISPFWTDAFILTVCLLVAGLASACLGQDMIWDIYNYHIYNPFAFLNGRFGIDVMPAKIHTFLNPLLDVPYYLFIQYLNNWPRLVAFLMGMPEGLLGFFLYKISRFLLRGLANRAVILVAVAAGCSGSMVIAQLGVTSHEVLLGAMILAGLYNLLVFVFKQPDREYLAGLAAFLVGAAAGLKYTAGPYVLALMAVFFSQWSHLRRPGRAFLWFTGGGIAGFLLVNGFFMMRLWLAYGNPFFPFLNGIFKSPYFDPVNFEDKAFYPRTALQYFFYPFFWIRKANTLVTDPGIVVADARMALAYIGGALGIGSLGLRWWKGKNPHMTARMRQESCLWIFLGIGYFFWQNIYSILRYAVVLESLSVLGLLIALRRICKNKWLTGLSLLVLGGLVWGTHYPTWYRLPYGDKVLEFYTPMRLLPNALVIYEEDGQSFMSPFFPKGTRFISIKLDPESYDSEYSQRLAKERLQFTDNYYAYHFDHKIQAAIDQHEGPIYIVATPWREMTSATTLDRYGLESMHWPCQLVACNFRKKGQWNVCRVRKKTVPQP